MENTECCNCDCCTCKGRKLNKIQKENNINEVYSSDTDIYNYIVKSVDGKKLLQVQFQEGPRNLDSSIDGVLDTDLLEMVRDRLTVFQNGEFANRYNLIALECVEGALNALNSRAKDRASRGVLGTYEK